MKTKEIYTTIAESTELSAGKIGLTTGLVVCGGLILFFFIMGAFDLLKIVELRSINFFILLAGILYSINKVKNLCGDNFDYFDGFSAGIFTALYSVVPFGIFVFIYLWKINPSFMEYIRENITYGNSLTPALATFAILVEGIVSGVVISFISMQYFKKFAKEPR